MRASVQPPGPLPHFLCPLVQLPLQDTSLPFVRSFSPGGGANPSIWFLWPDPNSLPVPCPCQPRCFIEKLPTTQFSSAVVHWLPEVSFCFSFLFLLCASIRFVLFFYPWSSCASRFVWRFVLTRYRHFFLRHYCLSLLTGFAFVVSRDFLSSPSCEPVPSPLLTPSFSFCLTFFNSSLAFWPGAVSSLHPFPGRQRFLRRFVCTSS